MECFDADLQQLISLAKSQRYLTYDQVNEYLPDEATSPEKLDNLLVALDELDIQVVEKPPLKLRAGSPAGEDDSADAGVKEPACPQELALLEPLAKLTDDPIRMYLTQMARIPLLTREEEISLAKKIEVTRKRFRRTLLRNHFALRQTVKTIRRVQSGELPFDRTIKVSLTECLTKEQIQARMPHNLPTLDHLLELDAADFSVLIKKSAAAEAKRAARTRFLRRRSKSLKLVEELSLRTRRVQPLIRQLEEMSARMDQVRRRLAELSGPAAADSEATRVARAAGRRSPEPVQSERPELRRELKQLMLAAMESPTSLRNRCGVLRSQFTEYELAKRQLSSGNLR